jgi:hypothetical protein
LAVPLFVQPWRYKCTAVESILLGELPTRNKKISVFWIGKRTRPPVGVCLTNTRRLAVHASKKAWEMACGLDFKVFGEQISSPEKPYILKQLLVNSSSEAKEKNQKLFVRQPCYVV